MTPPILDRISSDQPYATAKGYMLTGTVWAMVGAGFGVIAALSLVAPDLITHSGATSFGRLRPVHVNVVALGFVYSLLLGGAAWVVPRMCRVEGLWSERMGTLNLWLWNAVFVCAAYTLLGGQTQARELAELVWFIDVMVAVSVVLFTVNILLTILSRQERLLYVSIWYITGGLLWTAVVYVIGNVMWKPQTGALRGAVDPIWLWFYGHNVVGLILTPMATALAYYVIPRAVGRPVWSHNLSLIGFWALLVMYTHVGTHHIIQAPVPRWLIVIATVDSIGLIFPVSAVLLNLWLPMRGRWGAIHGNIGAKFVFMGTIWYFMTCTQGPMHSLPAVQRVTHFTHWVVAHAHMAILGFAGFIGIGTLYTVLPMIMKRQIWSKNLANIQYWLMLIGLTLMFVDLSMAGLVEGSQWLNGEAFYNVVRQMTIYHIVRIVAGMGIFLGLVLMGVNVFATVFLAAPEEESESGGGSGAGSEVSA